MLRLRVTVSDPKPADGLAGARLGPMNALNSLLLVYTCDSAPLSSRRSAASVKARLLVTRVNS